VPTQRAVGLVQADGLRCGCFGAVASAACLGKVLTQRAWAGGVCVCRRLQVQQGAGLRAQSARRPMRCCGYAGGV
jgi:hypothetical protein